MGWAYGTNAQGREVGYSVVASCDERGCPETIHRGLDHVCGGVHDGGAAGCGQYFCGSHLYYTAPGQLCVRCHERWGDEDPEDDQ